jgi:hypothetical protein
MADLRLDLGHDGAKFNGINAFVALHASRFRRQTHENVSKLRPLDTLPSANEER